MPWALVDDTHGRYFANNKTYFDDAKEERSMKKTCHIWVYLHCRLMEKHPKYQNKNSLNAYILRFLTNVRIDFYIINVYVFLNESIHSIDKTTVESEYREFRI